MREPSKLGMGPIFLTAFIDLLGVGIIIPILAPLLLEEGSLGMLEPGVPYATRTQLLGFLVASFSLVQFFAAPFIGLLSDRYGRRKVLLISLVVGLFGYLTFAFAIQQKLLWLLFVGRAIAGMAAGNLSVIYSAIADISEAEEKVKRFGLVGMAFGLGFIIGPVIGGVCSDPSIVSWFNFSTPFLLAAILVALNFLLVFFKFPETLKEPNPNTKVSLKAGLQNLGRALRNQTLRSIFASLFFFTFGFTFFTQFIQVFLIEKFQFSQAEIGYYFGYAGVIIAFTQGVLVRFTAEKFKAHHTLLAALLILTAAYLLLLVPDHVWGLYLVMPLIAIGQGLAAPNFSAIVSNSVSAQQQGETLGMQQSVQSAAQLVPPIIGGYAVAFTVEFPLWLAAACGAVAVLIFYAYSVSNKA